ncbi:MAG: alpha/beta hydrolase [Pseudomonadota bacterium]
MNLAIQHQMRQQGPAQPEWLEWAIAQQAQSGFVEANGNRLHYLEWNPHESDKPALLFVHGFRAHARWWDFVAPFFMRQYRVLALDLSGMGESGWREAYSAPQLAQDVTGFIDALGLAGLTVIAHSYGGLCTLRAASMRPELFGRVIVLDTFVLFEGETLPPDPRPIAGNRLYESRAAARQRYRLLPDQPVPDVALLDHIAMHSMRETEGGVRWKFDSRLQGGDTHLFDGAAMLGRITAPVDYVYGECSALVTPFYAQRTVDALPNSRGPVVIPSGHHHLMLDQPLALIATLRALLA